MKVTGQINPWIKQLKAYEPGKQVKGSIRLMSSENNYGPSPGVEEALKRCEIGRYCDPNYTLLKQKISEYCDVKPDKVTVTAGSDEAFDLASKIFLTRGCNVLAQYPTFPMYKIFATTYGARYLGIPAEADFSFNAEKFLKSVGGKHLIYLCNPVNPAGAKIQKEDIKAIVESAECPVIVDEAYYEFCGETAVDLTEEYDNLIVARTFSKAFGLAGARLGYVVANPEIISYYERVKSPWNVSSPAAFAGVAAMFDIPFMKKNVDKIINDRRLLEEFLSNYFKVYSSSANFVFFDVSGKLTSLEFFEKMKKHNIIVRRIGKLEGFEGDYIRTSVGKTEECTLFMEAVKAII